MVQKSSEHYLFQFHDNFVIVEGIEGAVINNEIGSEALKTVFDHYNEKDFTIITNRKNQYTVDIDIYASKWMKKVKALAIVSRDAAVKEKALAEQLEFDQSFAFFENLRDAVSWAESRGGGQ